MKQENLDYESFFKTAFGSKPYNYQVQIASEGVLPSLVNAPTGAGKTAAILGAWLRRRINETRLKEKVDRRLIYCLPMRILLSKQQR